MRERFEAGVGRLVVRSESRAADRHLPDTDGSIHCTFGTGTADALVEQVWLLARD